MRIFKAYIRTILLTLSLLTSAHLFAVGWLPTDGGLVVNLNQGDKFLLSVWLDLDKDGVEDPGEEFFVNNYNRYTGGHFNYDAGSYLKLLPQEGGATKPSDMTVWTVGAPLDRVDKDNVAKLGKDNNYDLGAGDLVYTMWNDGKTLRSDSSALYKFFGEFTADYNDKAACDVVFVVPTNHDGITSFDPNKTLKTAYRRTDQDSQGRFNGLTGTGFLGMTYREVYWMEIPRFNAEVSYTNAALVTFNTTLSNISSWRNAGTVKPGHAAWAYADNDGTSYHKTTRTIFRLYVLNDPIVSCPDSYFFATDEQDYKKFRRGPGGKQKLQWKDSTAMKKIYTWDRLTRMDRVDETTIHKTGYMNVPVSDSTYYYVGYQNDYKIGGEKMGTPGAHSQFIKIRELPLANMPGFKAPAGAYGRMVLDSTSAADNHAVAFEPKGYFFQTNSRMNVNMRQVDDSTWMVEDMWYIDPTYMTLQARIMLSTEAEFSAADPGAAIEEWSVYTNATDIPVVGGGGTASGQYGWARIHTNRAAQNGDMEFVVADQTKYVRYDNNGHFGATIPDQHPEYGKTKVAVQASRLIEGYNFTGWTTEANGGGTTYHAGDSIDLSGGPVTLYAQATYTGTINVAISFMQDGKRYFLTHPGAVAPRYASIRHFDDWTNVWQGMADINNDDPNYISTYKIIGKPTCIECDPDEYVLDPRNETMKGAVDSLVFYENFHPEEEEYIGLYYANPYTIVANNTWAGLFTSSAGWPTPANPCVTSTQLASDSYLERDGKGVIQKYARTVTPKDPASAALPAHIRYNSVSGEFDAVTGDGTDFTISGVGVVDNHYIILPDTSEAWRDTLTFGYHQGERITEQVRSALIGKQLLAQMKLGNDTIYFHPNRNKLINDPNELYLSSDFRITQLFKFIPDARVTSVAAEDRTTQEATSDYWLNNIISGQNSPIGVKYRGEYIDIVDTFRITLSHGSISKIKKYYGRWDQDAEGLTVSADGSSRYRDVIIRTKTYHYGDTIDKLVLVPEQESYSFNPLAGNNRQINFQLLKVRSRVLYDTHNDSIREDWVKTDTITKQLTLGPSACSFSSGGTTMFNVVNASTVSDHVTLSTAVDNKTGENLDTLIVSTTVDDVPVSVRVPLAQMALEGDELVWSVVHGNKRYFLVAGTDGIKFREFTEKNSVLYKQGTSTHLKKGSADAANSDNQYITPWAFGYTGSTVDQLWLQTKYGINKFFGTSADKPALLGDKDTTLWSYYYATDVYINDNGNEEEQVRLKYNTSSWLAFDGVKLTWAVDSASATVFTWSYLKPERYLLNNGTYPSRDTATFDYNVASSVNIQTRYKAYKDSSMLLNNKIVYLCREDENDIADLVNSSGEWLTDTTITLIRDARTFDKADPGDPDPVSGLSRTTNASNLTTTVTSTASSPTDVKIDGKYVNIVDTLDFRISLRSGAPSYKFQGNWSKYSSIEDAHVKIPLVRKTYHTASFDSVICTVDKNQTNIAFKPYITEGVNDTIKYLLSTIHRTGSQVLNIYNEVASVTSLTSTYVTQDKDKDNVGMHLNNAALAEVRLVDEYGNNPTWCKIKAKGDSTVTVQCLSDGIRSPRYAYLYFAYIVTIDGKMRFVNYRLTVSQTSKYDYVDNQILIHSKGASGDDFMANGMQQVHENKQIIYYYPDEDVELPVRERAFYGWWRWYREGKDEYGNEVADADIPDSLWVTMPRNTGKYTYPFRTIGNPDSVWVDPSDHSKGKHVVTMGRYTVFHYKSKEYGNKNDPPAKNPVVVPPINKDTLTYAVDISAYYDNLPMSLSQKNQVDTARLDTMLRIPEPTLSLREVFELHPWTEMAERLEGYKDTIESGYRNLKYMEDHTVMAPLGNRLLLRTEQRYNYDNLQSQGHSDSQLGYYMRDDRWSSFSSTPDASGISERDTMAWLGGWDADCVWYTYDPTAEAGSEYTECTHKITVENDFLNVPAKTSITPGKDADTVYYCLRARSKSSASRDATPTDGAYWFNICRYTVIYHPTAQYGPKLETAGKALITNEEIEQHYEVLERLNFDYNQPGSSYTVYPHPLPWADASYGYTYPETPDLPHNRYHDESDFPNHGEYGLINRIPYSSYWYKMEQHGGAENGYMIYCDGMASAGQVAALSLKTHLCEGQRMYFSAYVGNPSSQNGKSCPNFTFSVQGSENGTVWEDITSYMTGDLAPSNQWYQIYFPIQTTNSEAKKFEQFRVRIYNVAASFDGNDFIIDDMCIFATKPALVAYQANTTCGEGGNDSINHVIFRIDYQGINNSSYNDHDVFYTIEKITPSKDTSFVAVEDEYLNEETKKGAASKPDTIYGTIPMPAADYEPTHIDSVYSSVEDLVDRFDDTHASVKQGYVYEEVDNVVRPVMYVVHIAKVTLEDTYIVRMSADFSELINSICAMTDTVDISNRMMFEVDGVETASREITNLCPNSSYDIGVRVKGSLFLDGTSPMDINGTCFSDWLLYGDTAAASSRTRYKYTYSDIVKVVTDILRREDEANTNRFATNLSAVSSAVMTTMSAGVTLETSDNAYTVLSYLVNKGFLTLYQKKVTASLIAGDSVQYVALPITGTGYDDALKSEVQVCPNPMLIKLKPKAGAVHLVIGGLHRDSTQASAPVVILANEAKANDEFSIYIDSLINTVDLAVLDSIYITSSDDPNFRKGVHKLLLLPDREYDFGGGDNKDYYKSGDSIVLRPAASAYRMRPGYKYSFVITLQTRLRAKVDGDGCAIGSVPFVVSVVPDYIRWNPQTAESNQWNNPDNWLGVTSNNVPIHENAHFAPLPTSSVIIPTLSSGLPYPELPASISSADSIKEVGFTYNTCNAIRFMPGAAIGQQQRLDYNIAVVDMELPHNTWALRGAPINGLLSGDIYMANADYNGVTSPWEVSEFDASGRNAATGNASIWLSVYSRSTEHKDNGVNGEDEERTCTTAEWSKVTNGMTLSLPAAQGWAVYARTASTNNAVVRLPKNDDIYYYYSADGDKMHDIYVNNVRAARDAASDGAANTGKLSFHPDGASQNYTLAKDVADTMYVFGNPTMGYIDIWGFIADNGLENVIGYLDKNGHYKHVSKATAEASSNTIDNCSRYLPPQHAMIIKVSEESSSKIVTLNANRIVTNVDSIVRPLPSPSPAPRRNANANASANAKLPQGIMTVTAINPVSSRCTSYLHLGQGYHNALREGEDAILTTINIDKFSLTNTPTTPFNIYAVENGFGLSIDLRDSLVNVPLSFFMSDLPYDPTTHLWFTGVNNISGSLVLYDALTDTERAIYDGIRLDIETPEQSHETRYYIRRRGYKPNSGSDPIATGAEQFDTDGEQAVKIIKDGHVLIIRSGHVYTTFGQKLR